LQRFVTEAQALKRAEKPLTRIQQEALSVSDRLTLLARVMDGRALLIVPAPANETDPWVEPRLGRVEILCRCAIRAHPDSVASGCHRICGG